MARIIQAEAVVTAQDRTGETFAAIAQKVRGVTQAFKSLGGVATSGIGALNRNVTRMQHTVRTLAPIASGAAAYEGMRGLSGLVHETVKVTAERAHEQVRMELAGVAPNEREEADKLSLELSQRYKAFSQTDVLHALRNMRAIVGSFEEAAKLLDSVTQLRLAVLAQHPERAAELNEKFDKLMKSQEILGINQDPERFVKDMGLMGKAMAVFGDTLEPADWFAFAQHSRLAGQGFNDQFLYGVAPTLMQHMGGAQAGTALSSLFQALVGGHMTLASLNALKSMGLVDPKKVEYTKAGLPKKMLPGALVQNDLFKANQYEWIKTVLLPSLSAHGIKNKDDFENFAAILAQNRSAGQALAILATQQPNIEKDMALMARAPELKKQVEIAGRDPFIAMQGVAEQFKNLLAIAGGPLAGPATATFNALAGLIVKAEKAGEAYPLGATAGLATGAGAAGYFGYKLSRAALRRFFGMVRGGAASDLSAEAAIRAMQAAQVGGGGLGLGWLSSALPMLGVGATMADLELNKKPGARSYFSDRGGVGSEISALPALKAWEWLENHFKSSTALQPNAHGPEVKGSADLNVKVTVEPSDSFISRIEQAVQNAINVFGGAGEPGSGVGTAGSTGLSMPPAVPAP